MHELFRRGAFPGNTKDDAYFVRCDRSTTTQADIDAGIVNAQVGFAPLKPAEFIVLHFRQQTNQADSWSRGRAQWPRHTPAVRENAQPRDLVDESETLRHAVLGGVAAGFADYFNVDPSRLRSE